MDIVESLLREEFGRDVDLDTISVPDLISSTRRIRRRRTVTAAACVIAVVAALAVIGTSAFVGRPHAVEPAHHVYPIPGSVNPSLNASISETTHIGPGVPVNRRFVDAQHGFVLSRSCPTPFVGHTMADCTWALEATVDGGATFSRRTLPPATSEVWQENPLYVFDATHLLVEDPATLPGTAGPAMGGSGWVSSDGGRTWSVVRRVPVTMIDRIPAGTLLTQASYPAGTRVEPLLALRADGSALEITGTPADVGLASAIATPGSYFVTAGNDGVVVVSTDDGHGWRATNLPADSEADIIGMAGSRIYATFYKTASDGTEMVGVESSSDHGLTWHRVTLPPLTPDATPSLTPAQQDQGYTVYDRISVAASPDAGLLINDGARTWRMAPGSDRFVADDQAFPIIGLINAGPVVLAISADPSEPHAQAHLYISADGLHWRRVGSS